MARKKRAGRSAFSRLLLFSSLAHSSDLIVNRRVSYREGEAKVAAGEWSHVYREDGRLVGYESVCRATVPIVSAAESCAGIPAFEMQLNAFVVFRDGRSRTARMSEQERTSRTHPRSGAVLPAEDEVERTVAKVRLWPAVGGLRGVSVCQ